ncbi:AcrR family transcriptional regulator [Catenulispora sp. EB89]|uniref:TetR/AcrR family transcriptional regulator n=1 Tax=Catenulispora sp. EB89 TaxID=3156257 RepID=UPI00351679E2
MSPRMSAEERRDQVVRAAVAEFAVRGLEGTSTGDIAKRVGVSQPYLFRLFPTKRDLFIAAVQYGATQVRDVFTKAAEGKYGHAALAAMGDAYQNLLMEDRLVLNMQLQQFAACHDPEVQAAVRGAMQGLWQHMENLSGAPLGVRVDFLAKGMLCNVIAAMGRDNVEDPEWQPILNVLRDDTAVAADTAEELDAEAAKGCSDERSGSPAEPEYANYIAKAFTD